MNIVVNYRQYRMLDWCAHNCNYTAIHAFFSKLTIFRWSERDFHPYSESFNWLFLELRLPCKVQMAFSECSSCSHYHSSFSIIISIVLPTELNCFSSKTQLTFFWILYPYLADLADVGCGNLTATSIFILHLSSKFAECIWIFKRRDSQKISRVA